MTVEAPRRACTMHRPPSPPLIPPFRFACVEAGVYRGAHPSLKNLRYLTRLNLRSIISLIPDAASPSADLSEFCASLNITHYTHSVLKYDDGFSHTPSLVADVLAQLLDPANHPVFLHCLDGRQNTGLVVMCLRKLQNWGLSAILGEFDRYTKENTHTFNEKEFVHTFNVPVQLPYQVPHWLQNRVRFGPPDTAPALERPRSEQPGAMAAECDLGGELMPRDTHGSYAQAIGGYFPRHDARNVDALRFDEMAHPRHDA